MRFLAKRRGSIAALIVGVAVLALYVALQPGERPVALPPVTTTTTIPATTTTREPIEELCALAQEFASASVFQEPSVVSRLAEPFYARASELAPAEARPEFKAAADYYVEYNNIGEQYEYDLFAILASPDAQRWTFLVTREPLGVGAARAGVNFLCRVEVPPPPTVTTTTTTRPRPRPTEAPDGGAPADPASPPATPAPTTPSGTPG